jgi:hypothetical protein
MYIYHEPIRTNIYITPCQNMNIMKTTARGAFVRWLYLMEIRSVSILDLLQLAIE